MDTQIRPYRASDYQMICEWWGAAREFIPLPGMMTEDSSFVLEIDKVPTLAITVYFTNSKEVAWLDNFIAAPGTSGKVRKIAAKELVDYCAKFAKSNGFNRLFCMSEKAALVNRYNELGWTPTLKGLTILSRELT